MFQNLKQYLTRDSGFSPPGLSEEEEIMPSFRSIIAKYIFISIILLIFMALYIYVGFLFTHHMEGESKKINFAGRERSLSFMIAMHLEQIADMPPSLERKGIVKHIKKQINLYEEVLYALRDGSKKFGFSRVYDKKSIGLLRELIDIWDSYQKPTLYKLVENPDKAKLRFVHENVERIDRLVGSIERHHDREIKRFDTLRLWIIGLFSVVAIFMILFVKYSLVGPILKLRNTAKEIEKGNFDVNPDIKTRDEIKILSLSIQRMAQSLKAEFERNLRLLNNLRILHEVSNEIISKLDLNELMKKVVKRGGELIGARYTALVVLDERDEYKHFITAGIDPETFEKMKETHGLPHGKGVLGYLLKEGKPVRIDDISEHPASVGFPEGHPQMKTFLGVPIILHNKTIGRLYFTEKIEGEGFTQEDETLAILLANTVALAINNAEMVEEIRHLASFPQRSPFPITEYDMDLNVTYVNPVAEKFIEESGLDKDRPIPVDFTHIIDKLKLEGKEETFEEIEINGITFGVSIHILSSEGRIRVYAYDITELKRTKEILRRYNEELLKLNLASNLLLSIKDTEDVYNKICESACNIFDLKMVWLGIIDEENFYVKPVSVCGFEDGYLSEISIKLDDSPEAMGPTGLAIKTKTPKVIDDIEKSPGYKPWRDKALRRGYRSSMAAPLICARDIVLGALNLYSGEPYFFTEDRVRVIQAFTNQAATAIQNVRLVKELEDRVKKRTEELEDLNKSLVRANTMLSDQAEKLKVARNLAEAANKTKSQFLANMSHELRTPLNAILGFSELMAKGMSGEMSDKQIDYVKSIHESGAHLLNLIDDIIDLSKIETGKMELDYSDVDVKSLIESSLIFIKEKTMKHNIKIMVNVRRNVGSVEGDERRLKQVLVNLLSNAAKFTPDNGRIGIKAELIKQEYEGDSNSDCVEISVEDTGPGINPEDIPKLFKPFTQLGSPYQKSHRGTGLGLSICKRIIEAHGGKIWVESVWGKGSNFKFVIPCKKANYSETNTKSSSKKIVEPVTKLITWEYLLTHIERIISFHKRSGKQFGLLYLEVTSKDKYIDYLLFVNKLKESLCKHEILAHGQSSGCYYIVLLDSNRGIVDSAVSRINRVVDEMGYISTIKAALYKEDGETIEELLEKLNG
jgi:signal transduction histidine kinase